MIRLIIAYSILCLLISGLARQSVARLEHPSKNLMRMQLEYVAQLNAGIISGTIVDVISENKVIRTDAMEKLSGKGRDCLTSYRHLKLFCPRAANQ